MFRIKIKSVLHLVFYNSVFFWKDGRKIHQAPPWSVSLGLQIYFIAALILFENKQTQ